MECMLIFGKVKGLSAKLWDLARIWELFWHWKLVDLVHESWTNAGARSIMDKRPWPVEDLAGVAPRGCCRQQELTVLSWKGRGARCGPHSV
jgi:hypothetical protein